MSNSTWNLEVGKVVGKVGWTDGRTDGSPRNQRADLILLGQSPTNNWAAVAD